MAEKRKQETIKETIPIHFYNEVGQLKVTRGSYKDGTIALHSWDTVPDCEAENCPANALCTYTKKGKCQVQMSYLKGIQYIIFKNYAETMTEAALTRTMTGLVPLYQQFCELKIRKLGIPVSHLTYMTDRGLVKMHPILKEIRECVRLIEMTWHSLGLGKDIRVTPTEPNFKKKTNYSPTGSYYDQMVASQPSHFKQKLRIVKRKSNGAK